MTITLGYSRQSMPSALKIAEASGGQIEAVRSSDTDINWGRRFGAGLNPDITNAVNKRRMRELFAEHDVPAPRLYTAAEAEMRLAANAGTDSPVTLIGRPDFHTRKRGFWVCNTIADFDKAIVGTRRKMAATHFIEFAYPEQEFRVHIFNGRSIRISEKEFVEGRKYTTIKPTIPVGHIRKAAKAAVQAVGLDFGCVDILADAEHAYALEVNAAPGLGGSMPTLWADTFIKHFGGVPSVINSDGYDVEIDYRYGEES